MEIDDGNSNTRAGGSALTVVELPGLDDFETIESTQALAPGYYWTAVKAGEQFKEGDALLLMDVIEFEDVPHSVSIKMHPRHGSRSFTLLVADFLGSFVPCHDAEAIREREQREVLERVQEIQGELVRVQMSPQLMYEAVKDQVERDISKMEREGEQEQAQAKAKGDIASRDLGKVHRRAARRSEAAGNPLVVPAAAMASHVGSVLGAGVNQAGVEEMKRMAAQQAVVATAQAGWLKAKTEEISAVLGKLTPYMEEKSAVALARASGAIKMAKRIQDGIAGLDLYTGKGVEVFDVRVGKDAPASEKLTVLQGKRFMDEELAAWADVTDGFDFRDRQRFFDELRTNDLLLDQVIPAQRGVVSMAVTRRSRQYTDPLQGVMFNIENKLVFLLVRNGENVHAVYTGSPSHEAAQRLFPTREELDAPFTGFDGSRVSIRDVGFGKSSADFDNIRLLYTRFLILVCGLDHRLKLMGDFYPAEEALSFMSKGFQERYFEFRADDEAGSLLGDQMPDLDKWLEAKNSMLQSGSRVFVLRESTGLRENTPEMKRRSSLSSEQGQFKAPMVASREGTEHFLSVECFDRYDKDTLKAKCYLRGRITEDGHAWWLCIDGVSLEEVRRYRHSRVHRAMGVGYLLLFRRAEKYLEAELEQESAARAYLVSTAVEHGGMSAEEANASLRIGIRNWRASRRGEALPMADETERLNEVLSLMVPEGKVSSELEAMLDEFISQRGHKPLVMTRTGKAKLYLYVEATDEDKAAYPNVLTWGWVKRITLTVGKRKISEGSSSLVWMGKVLPASEVEVRRWAGCEYWMDDSSEPVPLRKYGKVLEMLAGSLAWESTLRGGKGAGFRPELFEALVAADKAERRIGKGSTVKRVFVSIPIGVFSKGGRKLTTIYMESEVNRVLAWYGTDEQRAIATSNYISRFYRKEQARAELAKPIAWRLVASSDALVQRHDEVSEDGVARSDSVEWMSHRCQQNRKRGEVHFLGTKKKLGAGPCLTQAHGTLSMNRALDELTGVAPVKLKKKFELDRREAIGYESRSSIWARDGESREEAEAKKKAKVAALRTKKYEHGYSAILSKLVVGKGGRCIANSLFVWPLTPAAQALAAKEAASKAQSSAQDAAESKGIGLENV